MLERGIVSRILFPAPPPSYDVDCFPHDLIWVPKTAVERPEDTSVCPPIEDCVPCLLLTYPSARFLIIFFHSNAEDLGRCHGFCCYIRDQFQVHVLAVEYPGYGICPGVPCGETVMENAVAAMNFVKDTLQWPMDSIKVFGRSIGTGPAIGLAATFSLAGLILVTPFLSVQDLFRDRVGPFASLVEEWFPNSEYALKITSPTMIIHGQRDELIACRHGESIYELLRPRKLLISPPDMEHNTNLLTNLQFFVLPMFQFFALPDYAFQDLMVPAWAYDKRRSAFYIRPSVEISSHQLPSTTGKKKKMLIPSGDDGAQPVAIDSPARRQEKIGLAAKLKKGSERALKGEAMLPPLAKRPESRELEPMFTSKAKPAPERRAPEVSPEVPEEANIAQEKPLLLTMKRDRPFERDACGASVGISSSPPPAMPGSASLTFPQGPKGPEPKGVAQVTSVSLSSCSPEAREAFQRLEAGNLCAREICSDELCVLEERMDADVEQNLRRQEKALTDLVRSRQAKHTGSGPEDTMPAAPRQLARRPWAGGLSCGGDQSMWPTWCSKQPTSPLEEEVHMYVGNEAPAPGLPPSDVGYPHLPPTSGALTSSGGSPSCASSPLHKRQPDGDGWEGWASSPATASSPSRSAAVPQAKVPDKAHLGASSRRSDGSGVGSSLKNPLFSTCCRALDSDMPGDTSSPPPRPASRRGDTREEEPVMPLLFGGRVIAGSHRPMSPEEDKLRRRYPLGTAAPQRRPSEDVAPAPVVTNGFQRGTKFAI